MNKQKEKKLPNDSISKEKLLENINKKKIK